MWRRSFLRQQTEWSMCRSNPDMRWSQTTETATGSSAQRDCWLEFQLQFWLHAKRNLCAFVRAHPAVCKARWRARGPRRAPTSSWARGRARCRSAATRRSRARTARLWSAGTGRRCAAWTTSSPLQTRTDHKSTTCCERAREILSTWLTWKLVTWQRRFSLSSDSHNTSHTFWCALGNISSTKNAFCCERHKNLFFPQLRYLAQANRSPHLP